MVFVKYIIVWLVLLHPRFGSGSTPKADHLNQIAAFSGGENMEHFHTHNIEIGRSRTELVRNILKDRLKYVETGKRMADFRTWIEKRRGGPVIISTHGGEVNFDSIPVPQQSNYDEEASSKALTAFSRNDPFSINRINLDLPANSLPNLYEGKPIHLTEELEPTFFQLFVRSIQLSIKFSPVLSTTLIAAVSKKYRKTWYKWVAACLGSTSAAFIKWGQWAATRSDMFPDLLCRELEQLQNSAPAHSWEFSERMLESSLGLPEHSLMDVFDDFQKKPLASGSIAQVYKAHLGGQPVAVKIRHPKVAQLLDMDFRIMAAFARIFDYIPGLAWLHIHDSVEQFSHTMAAQAHLQVEAHHLEVLNHNFRKWPTVKLPYPIYASSAVIIETFEPGVVVSEVVDAFEALTEDNGQSSKGVAVEEEDGTHSVKTSESASDLIPINMARFMVTTGVGLYLKMLLVDNLMHADLHPGNIMLTAVSKNQRKKLDSSGHDMDVLVPKVHPRHNADLLRKQEEACYRVTLVDAGMVAQLSEEESSTFIGFFSAMGEGDGRLAAKFTLRFSKENDGISPEVAEGLKQDMSDLFGKYCRGYGTNVEVGDVLRGILGLIRKHKVRIDANYATLVMNALCIESLAQKVCPEYNVLDAAEPLLRSYFKCFYESDGTPRNRKKAVAKFHRAIPGMYIRKNRNDNKFFRNQRKLRNARLSASNGSETIFGRLRRKFKL